MTEKNQKAAKDFSLNGLIAGLFQSCLKGLKWRFGFGRTIAILVEENAIQMTTARRIGIKSYLLNINKIYIPSSISPREKRQDFITAEIDNYVREQKGFRTRYILGVGGAESAVRILKLPQLAGKELRQAIYWAGNKQIPFSLDDAYYGHHIIVSTKNGISDAIDTSLIAVSKKEVHNRLGQIQNDVEIDAVYHELEAIGFLLKYIEDFSPEKTYTLLNIKKDHSEISFFRGMRLEFQHISSIGASNLGLTGNGEESIRTFADNLAEEIQNSLDYYAGQFSRMTTDTVYIYGDLSYSEELTDHLTDRFGIEFIRFPLNKLLLRQPRAKDFADQISVSLSTVAVALTDGDIINFLPPDQREEHLVGHFNQLAAPALILASILLTIFWVSFRHQVNSKESRLAQIDYDIEQYRHSPAYITYEKLRHQLMADKSLLEKLTHKPTFLNLNLKELSLLTPEKISIDAYDLSSDGNKFTLNLGGRALSAQQPPEVTLAEYIARLEGSPFFDKVALKKYGKRIDGGIFVIDFQIEMETTI
jgi:Tfp pilus assembly PilM family ATPase